MQDDTESLESSSDFDDEDVEKEEPKLKYEGIIGDLQEILNKDYASYIYVNDKVIFILKSILIIY